MRQIPHKKFYKVNEICRYTDTQPYVLKFWESEFPQLKPEKGPSGQTIYRRRDIELVLKIKKLLDEDAQTIAGARRLLEQEEGGKPAARKGSATRAKAGAAKAAAPAPAEARGRASGAGKTAPAISEAEMVPRFRYDNAVEEIAELRLELNQAETKLHKVESSLDQARAKEKGCRERSKKAISRIEDLLERLS